MGYATAHFWPQLIWIDLVIKDGNGKSAIKLSILCRWFSHDIFGFVSSRLEPTRFTGQWIGFREIDLQESMLVTPEAQGCEFPLQPIRLRNGGDEL